MWKKGRTEDLTPEGSLHEGVERRYFVRCQRADLAPDDTSGAIDHHRRRQHGRLKNVGQMPFRIERDGISDLLFAHELLDIIGPRLVDAHANDFESAARVPVVQRLQVN